MGLFLVPVVIIFFLTILGIGIRLAVIGIKENDNKSKILGLAVAILAIIVGYITIENMLNRL